MTKIQWTDETVNFWTGCKKVSKGCRFCYLYRDKERYGQDPTTILRTKDNTFYKALKWKDSKLIFTCSWSDFFIEEADVWRKDAWEVIKKTPQHKWQILTKRPERIMECLPDDWGKEGYPNVWLGVSVESSEYKSRIDILKNVPCTVHFLSIEPLIGSVGELDLSGIEWVIIGGESGNDTGKYRYRPCKTEWIDDVVHQCHMSDVPVFVKQLGTHLAKELKLKDRKGGDINEFQESLRFREYPIMEEK